MTDALATQSDLQQLEDRLGVHFARIDARFAQIDARFGQIDARFDRLEKRFDVGLEDYSAQITDQLADFERRISLVMLAGIGAVSALVKLL